MKRFFFCLGAAVIGLTTSNIYGQTFSVDHFHKVIISPYIQATFIQGDKEQVIVNSCVVDIKKLHVESKGNTLRVYLEGAKDIPHDEKNNGRSYPDGAVVATVVYKNLEALSLRGTESFVCESPLSAKDFTLNVYGEPEVTFKEVHIDNMHATIYGEGSVNIQSGSVNKQSYTCYGEGKINSTAISGQQARLTAYGEADFRVNVSQRIKITSFGEAKLSYMGNPEIVKGLHFGGVELEKLN